MQTPDPADTDRPDWACVLCPPPRDDGQWRQADPGYVTDSTCLDRIRETMWGRDRQAGGTATQAGIALRYQRLDPTPGRGAEAGGRGAPGFGSRSPASEHVIAFTDPRSSQTARTWLDRAGRPCHEDDRPPVSVRGELDLLAWTVAEQLGLNGPHHRADVPDLLRHLDARLDLVTRRAALTVEVATVLRALRSALRPVSGDPRPRFIGLCPELLPEPDEAGVPVVCGARLYAPPTGDAIACRSCARVWPRGEWLALGANLQQAS